jgi:hypothetical protein
MHLAILTPLVAYIYRTVAYHSKLKLPWNKIRGLDLLEKPVLAYSEVHISELWQKGLWRNSCIKMFNMIQLWGWTTVVIFND